MLEATVANSSVSRNWCIRQLQRFHGPLPLAAWLLLTVVSLALYCYQLRDARALTEHEIYVGGVAKQMWQQGEWLLPHVGDEPWLEKPPLPHWLVIGTSLALGRFDETTARLPCALAGVAVVLLVAGATARWYGPTSGLLAGLVQATCMYMIAYARVAECDMLLTLLIVCAMLAGEHLLRLPAEASRSETLRWKLTLWGVIGLTGLVKGPIFGAAIVLSPLGVWLLLRRDVRGMLRLASPLGMIFALVIMLSWPVAVIAVNPEALALWNDHLLGRLSGRLNFNQKPFWYYATTWPWQMLPWTPLLVYGAVSSLRKAWSERDSVERFLWCWALVPACVLSLSSGKHHHYLIHALPALAPLTVWGLLRAADDIRRGVRATRRLACGLLLFVVPGGVVAALILAIHPDLVRFAPALAVFAVIIAGGSAIVGWGMLEGHPRQAFVGLIVAIVLAELYLQSSIMPGRDRSAEDRQFLLAIEEHVPGDAPLATFGMADIARHIFYVERPLTATATVESLHLESAGEATYVIARARDAELLRAWGELSTVAASEHTRGEASPEDRFTLFRLSPLQRLATEPALGTSR